MERDVKKKLSRSTYQDNAAITFTYPLARLGLLESDAEVFAGRGNGIFDAVAFGHGQVELVGLDLEHLRLGIRIHIACFGQRNPLALWLGLLCRMLVADGSLAAATASRSLGGAAFLESG